MSDLSISPSFAQLCKTRPFVTLQRALIANRALVLPSANEWKVQPSVNFGIKRQLSFSIRRPIKWVHKDIQAK